MRRVLLPLFAAAALLLGGCHGAVVVSNAASTPITAAQVSDAKATAYAIESGYDALLTVAIAWGTATPLCAPDAGAQQFCHTNAGVLQIEKARQAVRAGLDAFNKVIADTTTTTSQLGAAISVLQQSYGAYQQVLAIFKVNVPGAVK